MGVLCVRKFKVWTKSAGGREAVTAKEMSDIKEKLGTLPWTKEKDVLRGKTLLVKGSVL